MEESKTLFEYESTDISGIKPARFTSEKEFEKEAKEICEVLQDIKELEQDWDKRHKAILRLQQIILSEDAKSMNYFSHFLVNLVKPLTNQVQDLRSAITKEASRTIAIMAETLQQDFEPLAPKYISKLSLYKLLNIANKVMAEHSHHCFVAILSNVVAPKVIANMAEENKTKNPQIRIKNAEFLHLILVKYPKSDILSQIGHVEELLLALLQDAKPEARQISRLAFFQFQELFPERAEVIMAKLPSQNGKALQGNQYLTSPRISSRMVSPNRSIVGLQLPTETDRKTRSMSRGRQQLAVEKKQIDPMAKTIAGGNFLQLLEKSDPIEEDAKEEIEDQKIDDRLKLLKKPVVGRNEAQNLAPNKSTGTGGLRGQRQMDHLSVQSNLNDASSSKPQASPSLPPESQYQLKNLKQKAQQKQIEVSSATYRPLKANTATVTNSERPTTPNSSRPQPLRKLKAGPDTESVQQKLKNLKQQTQLARKGAQSPHAAAYKTVQSKATTQIETGNPTLAIPKLRQNPNSARGTLPVPKANLKQPTLAKSNSNAAISPQKPKHKIAMNESEEKIFDDLDFLSANESIDSILKKCQSHDYKERIKNFNLLAHLGEHLNDCPTSTLKHFIDIHMRCLNDQYSKVVKEVQDSLRTFIAYQPNLLQPSLQKLLAIQLKHMVQEVNEILASSSSDLINDLCAVYPSDVLIPLIVQQVRDQKRNIKIVTAALEVLVVLLKEDYKYCQNNANIMEAVITITENLEDNPSNMDVIMPSLAAFLAIRDKNYEGLIKALMFVKKQPILLLKRLARQFARDFEDDIVTHVLPAEQNQLKRKVGGHSMKLSVDDSTTGTESLTLGKKQNSDDVRRKSYGNKALQNQINEMSNFAQKRDTSGSQKAERPSIGKYLSGNNLDPLMKFKSFEDEEEEEVFIKTQQTPLKMQQRPQITKRPSLTNQLSSNSKFIQSKVGDTLDDIDEEALSPTPRTAALFDKMDSDNQMTFSTIVPQFQLTEGDQVEKEFVKLLESSDNKQDFFKQIQHKAVTLNPQQWKSHSQETCQLLFEYLKSDDKQLRTQATDTLALIADAQFETIIEHEVFDKLADILANNKYSETHTYSIIAALVMAGGPTRVMRKLKPKLDDSDHPNLAQIIKFVSSVLQNADRKDVPAAAVNIADTLTHLTGHKLAQVRKAIIFTFVDLYFLMDQADFDAHLMQNMSSKERSLIEVYIKKKQEQK